MISSKKICAALLSFLMIFSGGFISGTARANETAPAPAPAPVPVIDQPVLPLQAETSLAAETAPIQTAPAPGSQADSTDFLADSSALEKAAAPAEEVSIYEEVTALSNDPYYGTFKMWGYTDVNAEKAHTLNKGAGISIAVIDTGLDFNHEDILGNIYTNTAELNGLPGVDDDGDGLVDDIHGWDFVNNDNNPTDDHGHGSHVSGIAAAVADNGKGIAGIAPDSKILPVKVLDAGGSGTIENVIKGIKYAADLGAKVINMSLGIAKRFLSASLLGAFQDAVNYAMNKGSIVVTAAGNESVDTSTTAPAGLDNTIAVGAVDSSNRKASFSNKSPDLVAPGVSITSLKAGGGYISYSGTSMASPYVAGAAALILSYFGATYTSLGYTCQQIYNDVYTRLTRSALNLGKKGYDSSFGYGLLDAYKALTISTGSGFSVNEDVETGPHGGPGNGFLPDGVSFSQVLSSFASGEGLPAVFGRMGNWYQIRALDSGDSVSKRRKGLRPAF